MTDIFGKALLDYFNGKYTEDLITETSISEADELPLPYLFRSFHDMPELEKKALRLCNGRVLDVGCGSGSHALYLQQKGMVVTAIDQSEGAVEVAKLRGVESALNLALLDLKKEKFDTILLLMNGSGIFETIEKLPVYLRHLKSLLTTTGQILVDSSDLIYMYDKSEDGGVWVPGDKYYGEIEYILKYKKWVSEPINWLYLDESRFEAYAMESGFNFEVMERGENYDFLARLSI